MAALLEHCTFAESAKEREFLPLSSYGLADRLEACKDSVGSGYSSLCLL
jgi:hypothetical protein